jgi:hypothetical protein
MDGEGYECHLQDNLYATKTFKQFYEEVLAFLKDPKEIINFNRLADCLEKNITYKPLHTCKNSHLYHDAIRHRLFVKRQFSKMSAALVHMYIYMYVYLRIYIHALCKKYIMYTYIVMLLEHFYALLL